MCMVLEIYIYIVTICIVHFKLKKDDGPFLTLFLLEISHEKLYILLLKSWAL